MTGKEAIIHYLGTHNSFCAPDVAALTGATVTSINQAAAKMARAGLLVIEGKVWRTVYYRFATREEREGKMTIYITELITGLLVIAGLFIWGRGKS